MVNHGPKGERFRPQANRRRAGSARTVWRRNWLDMQQPMSFPSERNASLGYLAAMTHRLCGNVLGKRFREAGIDIAAEQRGAWPPVTEAHLPTPGHSSARPEKKPLQTEVPRRVIASVFAPPEKALHKTCRIESAWRHRRRRPPAECVPCRCRRRGPSGL